MWASVLICTFLELYTTVCGLPTAGCKGLRALCCWCIRAGLWVIWVQSPLLECVH